MRNAFSKRAVVKSKYQALTTLNREAETGNAQARTESREVKVENREAKMRNREHKMEKMEVKMRNREHEMENREAKMNFEQMCASNDAPQTSAQDEIGGFANLVLNPFCASNRWEVSRPY
jgi:hypothetical protein